VLFVAIHCDPDELERRQRQRSDRNPNFTREYLASAQIRAHAHGIYDLEVDTTHLTPHQCADIIKEHLQNGPTPEAFRGIRDKYISI
jgi:chloramphenicol 3-O phosphotransferase